MGNKESEIRSFFTDEVIHFFENHQIYHLESNGEALIIFDKIKWQRKIDLHMIDAFESID